MFFCFTCDGCYCFLSLSWVFWDFLCLGFFIFLGSFDEDVPKVSAMKLFLCWSSFISDAYYIMSNFYVNFIVESF